ncbi:actin cytoskeleton-regulatory complex protein PAN1 [Manduca sexta]|uniref:actin cytoskeleton-regulatory complex protein PAN1 n=1 Tax=Manduca sexta TaxID=7130 RepID=UPI00188DF783|nr:actin cytoskeleton-regulatory complex protein PAN1 [Manduca sexta]XP_030032312.2 actin cytoskeleton-regulatory complex protein PAN1 [Manduca sexta]
MKFLLSFAAVIAVASAAKLGVSPVPAGPASLVDENGNPISADFAPINIGPAIIEHPPSAVGPAIIEAGDIAVGPAIIDFPLPDGGAASAPVVPGPAAAPAAVPASSPLVQIVVNVNAPAGAGPVVDAVADKPMDIIDVMPVVDPVQVVDTPIVVDPVQVVDTPIVVDPVQVVDLTPAVIEPVAVGTPILPVPAINLPEELN